MLVMTPQLLLNMLEAGAAHFSQIKLLVGGRSGAGLSVCNKRKRALHRHAAATHPPVWWPCCACVAVAAGLG